MEDLPKDMKLHHTPAPSFAMLYVLYGVYLCLPAKKKQQLTHYFCHYWLKIAQEQYCNPWEDLQKNPRNPSQQTHAKPKL